MSALSIKFTHLGAKITAKYRESHGHSYLNVWRDDAPIAEEEIFGYSPECANRVGLTKVAIEACQEYDAGVAWADAVDAHWDSLQSR